MEKKPPDSPKKPNPPKAGERGDGETDKAHRHRFTDSEKTTIMPLAEILKARDAARGTPAAPVVDKFPEFSYQPTVKVAIPAELLKRKQAEAAARDAAAAAPPPKEAAPKEAPKPVKLPDSLTPRGDAKNDITVGLPPPPGASVPQAAASGTSPTAVPAAEVKPPPEPRKPALPVVVPTQAPAPPAAHHPPEFKKASEPKPPVVKEEALPSIAAPMEAPVVPAAPDGTNQVLVFFSCKGGSGTTALSTNIAHYCAGNKKKTVLVDLDLQLGDALAAMSLQPGMTIAKAMDEAQRGGNMATMPLPRHATGVSVLSQVGSLDDLDKISSEGISRFVEGLRASFDTIVVDGVRDFSDNVLAVLDVADKIAIVTVQEVLAIKRARWAFGILRKIGFDGRDITVVINRYANDEMIPFHTLRQMFEPAPVFAVPADGPLVLQSLNQGASLLELAPTHTVTRNITRLAKNLLGEQVEEVVEATVVAKSFWDRLRPGKRE